MPERRKDKREDNMFKRVQPILVFILALATVALLGYSHAWAAQCGAPSPTTVTVDNGNIQFNYEQCTGDLTTAYIKNEAGDLEQATFVTPVYICDGDPLETGTQCWIMVGAGPKGCVLYSNPITGVNGGSGICLRCR
jgi:hypothetical protein